MSNSPRDITQIRGNSILPTRTLYFEDRIPASKDCRESWFQRAIKNIRKANVVFIDPDKGLKTDDSSTEHVSVTELRELHQKGKSLVIYHHIPQRIDAGKDITKWSDTLIKKLGLNTPPLALRYHRGTSRVFFIVAQESHRKTLDDMVNKFECGPWGQKHGFRDPHFERYFKP